MADKTEKEIGEHAARMVRTQLMTEITSSGLTISGDNNYGRYDFPTSKTVMKYRMAGDELDAILLSAGRHIFIQHFGVENMRKEHTVRIKKTGTEFTRRAHPFILKARNMIDDAVINSGALEYIADELTEIKTDVVLNYTKLGISNHGKNSTR